MQQITPPSRAQWETAGVVLAVLAAVYAIVRWPLWWSWQRLTAMAVAKELDELRETSRLARANHDILTAHEAAIQAMGVALREVPRMSGVVSEMSSTVKELNGTIKAVHQTLLTHGEDIGEIRGALQTGQWQGEERRRKGRRVDDPPMETE